MATRKHFGGSTVAVQCQAGVITDCHPTAPVLPSYCHSRRTRGRGPSTLWLIKEHNFTPNLSYMDVWFGLPPLHFLKFVVTPTCCFSTTSACNMKRLLEPLAMLKTKLTSNVKHKASRPLTNNVKNKASKPLAVLRIRLAYC